MGGGERGEVGGGGRESERESEIFEVQKAAQEFNSRQANTCASVVHFA